MTAAQNRLLFYAEHTQPWFTVCNTPQEEGDGQITTDSFNWLILTQRIRYLHQKQLTFDERVQMCIDFALRKIENGINGAELYAQLKIHNKSLVSTNN